MLSSEINLLEIDMPLSDFEMSLILRNHLFFFFKEEVGLYFLEQVLE
jgi:aminopeptidase C